MSGTRIRSNGATRAVIAGVAVLAVLAPGRALADDALGLGDPVGAAAGQITQDATQTVSEATQDATQTVSEATQDATQTVSEATQDATQTVSEATQDATQTVSEATQDATQTVSEATQTVSDATKAETSVTGRSDPVVSVPATPSDTRMAWSEEGAAPASRTAGSTPVAIQAHEFVGVTSATYAGSPTAASRLVLGQGGEPSSAGDDPCEADTQVVCLGLLYGLGDFADAGTKVLGILALTGFGFPGLALLALGLGLVGFGALAVSRRQAALVAD